MTEIMPVPRNLILLSYQQGALHARFAYTLPIADFFAKKCKIRLDI